LAGHAASNGGVALGLVLDVAHVAAAALWLGGLAVLAALLVPGGRARRAGDPSVDLGSVAARISACAFGAVVVIVASGVVQSLRSVGSRYALFHTTYGVTLLVKIGIVAVLVAVGGLSRRFLRRAIRGAASPDVAPRVASDGAFTTGSPPASSTPGDPATPRGGAVLTRPSPADVAVHPSPAPAGLEPAAVRKLRRSVLAETGLAVAVLAVTALLVNAVPAKQAAAQPFTSTFDVLGVQVNAVIGPARVGPDNQFHFYVLGRQGQPEGIPELDATMSLPGQGIGPIVIPLRVGGPGHYLATRVAVPFAGVWDLKLTVRTSSIDEQEVFAHVPVR
jgi:copper transport protein